MIRINMGMSILIIGNLKNFSMCMIVDFFYCPMIRGLVQLYYIGFRFIIVWISVCVFNYYINDSKLSPIILNN